MATSTALRHPTAHPWLSISSLVLVTLAGIGLAGLPGLLGGGILAVSWRRLAPEATFTLGQFVLVAAAPDALGVMSGLDSQLWLLGLGEVGLFGLLLAPPRDTTQAPTPRALGVLASVTAVGGVVGWLSVTAWQVSLWLVVLGLAGVGGGIVYLLYAYERWVLTPPPDQTSNYE